MRLWKEILTTIEGLLVPPLSDRPTEMRPLSEKELDVVYKWLGVRPLHPIPRQPIPADPECVATPRCSSWSASSTAQEKVYRSRICAMPITSVSYRSPQ